MEKILSERFRVPIIIIEQRDKLGKSVSNSDTDHDIEYVHFRSPASSYLHIVNSTTLSLFSLQNVTAYDNIDIKFKHCEKISKLEELIKYNFNTQMRRSSIIINTQYCDITVNTPYEIYVSCLKLYIYDKDSKSYIFYRDIDLVTIYDILDHPILQPFRINHSKPINPAMFE